MAEKQELLNETQISFVNEDGSEELCQILFTFHDEASKKDYMFFYPVGAMEESENDDEELSVYCATYEIKDGEICNIKEVNTDNEEENKMIEEVFNQYLADCEGECDCEECEGECECEDEHCCCHHEK